MRRDWYPFEDDDWLVFADRLQESGWPYEGRRILLLLPLVQRGLNSRVRMRTDHAEELIRVLWKLEDDLRAYLTARPIDRHTARPR